MEEKRTVSPKANRILYAVVVSVLCALAVIIAVFAAAKSRTNPTLISTRGSLPAESVRLVRARACRPIIRSENALRWHTTREKRKVAKNVPYAL